VISDHQKKIFRQNISNKGKFIKSGLWSLSRHPNYFGEIILWLGISIIALPTMDGFKYIVLISPVFVYILLTKISGIPMLEKSSDAKWGDNPDYIEYKKNTPVLFFKKPNL
jgi:steroid 5-alpha reductase family enzyme